MIYDHRTYQCKYGMVPAHMALYEKMGLATQTKYLGQPVLYCSTEFGDVNSFVHVWAFKDLADRTQKRAAMSSDPDWQTFVKASKELGAIIGQESKILIPASFFKGA